MTESLKPSNEITARKEKKERRKNKKLTAHFLQ
jgi:hypothetical protein